MATNTAGQTLSGNSAPIDAPNIKVGRDSFDGTAIVTTDYVQVEVGFTPKYIVWENVTSCIKGEWYEGMAANSCIKTVAAGTRTLEVTGGNGGITVCDSDGTANANGRYFKVLQNATLALVLANKVCNWKAEC